MIKKILIVMTSIILIISACQNKTKHTIRISGAWALFPMMNVWAAEYQKTHDVIIEISGGGAGKGMSDVLNAQVDIAMCSRPIRKEEIQQGAFYLSVAKDAVIATINSANPVLKEIYEQGLSKNDLEAVFLKRITHWGELVGKKIEDDKIIVLGRADASGAAKVWADFLGNYTQSDLQDKADANYSGDQAMCNGVQSNKNAIGFNNLNYAYNIENESFAEHIRPLPVDLNNDNILNKNENFYNNRRDLVAKVSEGIYPSPPSRLEYVVSKGSFQEPVKKFIRWVLTEGQQFVTENGYVKLPKKEIEKELHYLKSGHRE